jgi:hypothetical protein
MLIDEIAVHVDAGLGGLDVGRRAHAGRRVRLHRDRHAARFLEPRHELERDIRPQQPRHVLDADRVDAEILDALAHVDVGVDRVHGAHGVRDRALRVLAHAQSRLDGGFEIAEVVQRVEDPEHVDAGFGRALDERFDDVVGVVPVAEQILAAQQHLLARSRHGLLELPQPVPRILAEVTDAGVERGAAPRLDRPESDGVELLGDRQHVVDAQPSREQRLMRVAEHELSE